MSHGCPQDPPDPGVTKLQRSCAIHCGNFHPERWAPKRTGEEEEEAEEEEEEEEYYYFQKCPRRSLPNSHPEEWLRLFEVVRLLRLLRVFWKLPRPSSKLPRLKPPQC